MIPFLILLRCLDLIIFLILIDCLNVNFTPHQKNTVILRISDKFWEFKKIQHKNIYEFIARNITESYKLKQELEKKNQTLQQINERLIKFGKEMEQVTREQEILNAKILSAKLKNILPK